MLECVVNISEGRDRATIDAIGAAAGPDLLDVHTDPDHHRSVLTLRGTDAPRAVAAVDRWVDATLGTDGLADTSDPDAAVRLLGLVDAALGLSLWPR